jgi:hypothetical protein
MIKPTAYKLLISPYSVPNLIKLNFQLTSRKYAITLSELQLLLVVRPAIVQAISGRLRVVRPRLKSESIFALPYALHSKTKLSALLVT